MQRPVPPVAEPQRVDARSEAQAELISLAGRRSGNIPAELLAQHVVSTYGAAEWPVKRAALEALVRRFAFARRDGLRVAKRPQGTPFGIYATRRPRQKARPYRTLLEAFRPLRGSCDCPDFRRASLGLCKHLLVVLDDLAARPRLLRKALESAPTALARARLAWAPVRPLLGQGDWMERIVLIAGQNGEARNASERALARRFVQRVGEGGLLGRTFADDPKQRLELVDALAESLRLCRGVAQDPALAARLAEEREQLERVLALRARAPQLRRALRSLKRPLYPYQLEGVQRFLAGGRLLLADDMGLGKTAQAIAACHALLGAGLVERGLLVVPASLKHQWLREWDAFSDAPIEVVDGSPAERAAAYRRVRRGFLVANYEQVLRDLELMQRWQPELVVLDEAQRIKNWAAKTSHGVKELRPVHRLVLTGTPMENRLEELASIFDWVDDHALEPKWRLVPFHAERDDGERALVGVRHLDVLRGRIAHCTVRRVRGDILSQLPPRTDTLIEVPLTADQREQHDQLTRPISALTSKARRRPLTQPEFLRLMQLLNTQRIIANGLAQLDFTSVWPSIRERRPSARLLRGLFSPKLVEFRELVEQLVLEQGRRVVVFSQWRRMLSLAHWAIGDLLEQQGLDARFFSGQEKAARRTQNLVDFHDDERVRVLFATDAGGVGLNLQHAANACVNLELPWNPAVLEQRIGRIHRLGQSEPIDSYALVSADSIEQRIARVVADKQELFRGLFDGDSDTVRFEGAGSFMQSVGRIVEAAEGVARPRAADGDDDEDLAEADGSELDALVGSADEAADDSEPAPRALPEADEVRRLFTRLQVERTESGGLRIEAPPAEAATLVAVFEGLAALMASAASRGAGS
jgi:superfamily II DNA or RNA helicase